MEKIYITTSNGKTELHPIWCEVTNDQIGWMTVIPEDKKTEWNPAYVSFEIVNEDGLQLQDCSNISTF